MFACDFEHFRKYSAALLGWFESLGKGSTATFLLDTAYFLPPPHCHLHFTPSPISCEFTLHCGGSEWTSPRNVYLNSYLRTKRRLFRDKNAIVLYVSHDYVVFILFISNFIGFKNFFFHFWPHFNYHACFAFVDKLCTLYFFFSILSYIVFLLNCLVFSYYQLISCKWVRVLRQIVISLQPFCEALPIFYRRTSAVLCVCLGKFYIHFSKLSRFRVLFADNDNYGYYGT